MVLRAALFGLVIGLGFVSTTAKADALADGLKEAFSRAEGASYFNKLLNLYEKGNIPTDENLSQDNLFRGEFVSPNKPHLRIPIALLLKLDESPVFGTNIYAEPMGYPQGSNSGIIFLINKWIQSDVNAGRKQPLIKSSQENAWLDERLPVNESKLNYVSTKISYRELDLSERTAKLLVFKNTCEDSRGCLKTICVDEDCNTSKVDPDSPKYKKGDLMRAGYVYLKLAN